MVIPLNSPEVDINCLLIFIWESCHSKSIHISECSICESVLVTATVIIYQVRFMLLIAQSLIYHSLVYILLYKTIHCL